MQPLHSPLSPDDPEAWLTRVAPSRLDHAFPWRALRYAGVHLAFGSDWPVVPAEPLLGFYAACNRLPLRADGLSHQQALTETIDSYTVDGAYTEFQEGKKGQIEVGRWADLVLLDRDIFAHPAELIAEATVSLTICNGQTVFEK